MDSIKELYSMMPENNNKMAPAGIAKAKSIEVRRLLRE